MAPARHVAEWMTLAALAAKGPFRVSLSGGSTPKTPYQLLASDEFGGRFPWQRVFWYWGDEPFVPYDHPDSKSHGLGRLSGFSTRKRPNPGPGERLPNRKSRQ
jgi:6-phosphogluconolactonase/glucosamine-6-phosphate isomerase/deaminase